MDGIDEVEVDAIDCGRSTCSNVTEETRTNKRTARGIPPKIPLVISITCCLARNLEVDKKTKKCYRFGDMSARDEVHVYTFELVSTNNR